MAKKAPKQLMVKLPLDDNDFALALRIPSEFSGNPTEIQPGVYAVYKLVGQVNIQHELKVTKRG